MVLDEATIIPTSAQAGSGGEEKYYQKYVPLGVLSPCQKLLGGRNGSDVTRTKDTLYYLRIFSFDKSLLKNAQISLPVSGSHS